MPATLSESTSPACGLMIEAVSEIRLPFPPSVTETWPALPIATGAALVNVVVLFVVGLLSSTTGGTLIVLTTGMLLSSVVGHDADGFLADTGAARGVVVRYRL